MLNEEQVPRTGVQIARLWRALMGVDGQRHFWIGRRKRLTARQSSARLEYDYIEGPG